MWFGPIARLLSDGLRPVAVPCGPSNPTPRPSKLAIRGAGGRVPCEFCSTLVTGALGGGASVSREFARSAPASGGDVPHPLSASTQVSGAPPASINDERGGERSNAAAWWTVILRFEAPGTRLA